jgi:hypothetical protein
MKTEDRMRFKTWKMRIAAAAILAMTATAGFAAKYETIDAQA